MIIIKDYIKIFIRKLKKYFLFPLLLLIYVLIFHFFLPEYSSCLVKEAIGIPCAGCGITRSIISLFSFDIKNAFYYYPLLPLILFMIFVFVFNERPKIRKIYDSKKFWIICLILIFSVYILRMIFIFPNEPMDYYPKNLWLLLRSIFN